MNFRSNFLYRKHYPPITALFCRRILIERASRTCHVASPDLILRLKRSASLFPGSSRFRCMTDRLVSDTRRRILSSLPTSLSATRREIPAQLTVPANGNRIPSAMRTGTHPTATDSTRRGLHGAQPRGHRQKTDRAISDRNPSNRFRFRKNRWSAPYRLQIFVLTPLKKTHHIKKKVAEKCRI